MYTRVDLHDKPLASYDLYLGRHNKWLNLPGSDWANPYFMKNEGAREVVLTRYEEHIRARPDLIAKLPDLFEHNLVLACWCKLDRKCHIDVLYDLYKEFHGSKNE